jgi:hypothetical protein
LVPIDLFLFGGGFYGTRFTRFTRKSLQSKRATASLLIKNNEFMYVEKIESVAVLVQNSRNILGSCEETLYGGVCSGK